MISEVNYPHLSISQRRLWRTLVNIEKIDKEANLIVLEIPGWNFGVNVSFNLDIIPEEIRNRITEQNFLFAKVNVAVEKQEDLVIQDFEIGIEPPVDFAPLTIC